MKKLLVTICVVSVCIGIFCLFQTKKTEQVAKTLVTKAFQEADIQINGSRPWDIVVHNEAFYSRVVAEGSLGFGESYMEGMWDCKAIDQCIFRLLTAKIEEKQNLFTWKNIWCVIQSKVLNLQNRSKSMEVIDLHYNLGNELYRKMLGPAMAYSCGYFRNATTLEGAQRAKYDLICRKFIPLGGMPVLTGAILGLVPIFSQEEFSLLSQR